MTIVNKTSLKLKENYLKPVKSIPYCIDIARDVLSQVFNGKLKSELSPELFQKLATVQEMLDDTNDMLCKFLTKKIKLTYYFD